MNIDINNPQRKYRVIYADPAWKFVNRNTGGSMTSSAENKYTVTSVADMAAMPVVELADDLVMLPGWEQSEGAYIEFCLAKKSGKTIRELGGRVIHQGDSNE